MKRRDIFFLGPALLAGALATLPYRDPPPRSRLREVPQTPWPRRPDRLDYAANTAGDAAYEHAHLAWELAIQRAKRERGFGVRGDWASYAREKPAQWAARIVDRPSGPGRGERVWEEMKRKRRSRPIYELRSDGRYIIGVELESV